jgi:hypothetical protein
MFLSVFPQQDGLIKVQTASSSAHLGHALIPIFRLAISESRRKAQNTSRDLKYTPSNGVLASVHSGPEFGFVYFVILQRACRATGRIDIGTVMVNSSPEYDEKKGECWPVVTLGMDDQRIVSPVLRRDRKDNI